MADEIDFSKIAYLGNEKMAADPEPKKSRASSGRGPGRPSNDSKLTDVRKELGQLVKFIAMPLQMRDIHPDGSSCANLFIYLNEKSSKIELTPEATNFVDALAEVVFESKFLMKVLESGDLFGKYGALIMAAFPLGMGIYENHRRNPYADRTGEMV